MAAVVASSAWPSYPSPAPPPPPASPSAAGLRNNNNSSSNNNNTNNNNNNNAAFHQFPATNMQHHQRPQPQGHRDQDVSSTLHSGISRLDHSNPVDPAGSNSNSNSSGGSGKPINSGTAIPSNGDSSTSLLSSSSSNPGQPNSAQQQQQQQYHHQRPTPIRSPSSAASSHNSNPLTLSAIGSGRSTASSGTSPPSSSRIHDGERSSSSYTHPNTSRSSFSDVLPNGESVTATKAGASSNNSRTTANGQEHGYGLASSGAANIELAVGSTTTVNLQQLPWPTSSSSSSSAPSSAPSPSSSAGAGAGAGAAAAANLGGARDSSSGGSAGARLFSPTSLSYNHHQQQYPDQQQPQRQNNFYQAGNLYQASLNHQQHQQQQQQGDSLLPRPRENARQHSSSSVSSSSAVSNVSGGPAGAGALAMAKNPATSPGSSGLGLAGPPPTDSAARFALSTGATLSQLSLDDEAEKLAKSRQQKDMDDIDSGQRASATLWMGDLEGWMDETYIRRCISALGWDRDENGQHTVQTSVKMIKGASSTSGYCFITFPTSAHASSVLAHFSKQPPTLMPGSERMFKLNWATGLPGVQPKWEGEYSVFVGDLGREATEGELVTLFTPLFPSTKSAKIMYDPATGLSRGYGFVRFGDENDMQRSLALGQNSSGSGLSLRGRTLRISEASGSSGAARTRTTSNNNNSSIGNSHASMVVDNGKDSNGAGPEHGSNSKNVRDLNINVTSGGEQKGSSHPADRRPGSGVTSPNLLSPDATGFSIPLSSPGHLQRQSPNGLTSPSAFSPNGEGGRSSSSGPLSPSADPNNTTVFVGGLPACISEETLRSFFVHFGEITYVKIPPNKGCGFVQFVRRPDAELAIAKMHDFPIHGKSRIRLSWGRSQGDKQVEHVRKLATALNVPFEAVWRMVQGQDNSTIKQIASAVGAGNGTQTRRGPEAEAVRADLARLTGLAGNAGTNGGSGSHNGIVKRGNLFDSAGFGRPQSGAANGRAGGPHPPGPPPPPPSFAPSEGPHRSSLDFQGFSYRPAVPGVLSPEHFGWTGPTARDNSNGPYARVSPSAFAPMSTSNLGGHHQQTVPLAAHPSLPPPHLGPGGAAMYGQNPAPATGLGQHHNHRQHPLYGFNGSSNNGNTREEGSDPTSRMHNPYPHNLPNRAAGMDGQYREDPSAREEFSLSGGSWRDYPPPPPPPPHHHEFAYRNDEGARALLPDFLNRDSPSISQDGTHSPQRTSNGVFNDGY